MALLTTPWGLGLVGLCVGSFLNVVIHRLPRRLERQWRRESAELLGLGAAAAGTDPADEGEGLARPRSRCPACRTPIRWQHNLPLIGWLVLRGRCAACRAPISLRYPLVEAACGLLFAAVAWRFGGQPVALAWCAFVAVLLALAGIDWDTTLLPDDLTLPLLWGGLLAALAGWTLPLASAVWGAVAGYLSLWTVYWGFKLLTGKEGMGHGDFKLLAALGAWLGPAMIVPIVLAASVIGAFVGILMKVGDSLREGRYVPFGPFLALAGIAVMLAGPPRVLDWLGWS
ncbi:prepilin peptidase [Piscinibacter sakaiensis]|uniref:prepilin peptidase n=1 Tax=Piscinibacter sakaiensis TaxID=1547922 RepID=UPI0006B54669|nr:A24 family peptidase [Piscinibacter sakaiensis]